MSEEPDSHYVFGQGLRLIPGMLDQFSSHIGELARQADEVMPTSTSIRDEIMEIAAAVQKTAQDSGSWYPTWRDQHQRTVERVEHPKTGSVARAERDDSGMARREI